MVVALPQWPPTSPNITNADQETVTAASSPRGRVDYACHPNGLMYSLSLI